MKVKKTKNPSRKVDAVTVAPGRVENTINKSPATPAAVKQVQQNDNIVPEKVRREIQMLLGQLICGHNDGGGKS